MVLMRNLRRLEHGHLGFLDDRFFDFSCVRLHCTPILLQFVYQNASMTSSVILVERQSALQHKMLSTCKLHLYN